jgi:hypothetical protein
MQKRYVLLPLLLFVASACFSQFKKGDRMVGASVGNVFFNSGSGDQKVVSIGSQNYKTTGWGVNINPNMGWFISEKTAIGATLNINPTSQKTSFESNGSTFQKDNAKNFNIGIGGFVRHYLKGSGSFLPFGQFSINAGVSTSETDGFFFGGAGSSVYKDTYDGKSSGGFFLNSSFNVGMTKKVSDKTGLDIFIGYNFSTSKNTFKITRQRDNGNDGSIDTRAENETTTNFTNHGFVIGAGFQIFLGKKK